jgi:MinD-like ATPase involved in chromosome partitioning or flagellar assembly
VGKIITFYSYKGGTGRSMLLANVAWLLASHGRRVLAVDWDLEAPGLHRYFRPFLRDPDLLSSDGVIDFVVDYASAAVTPAQTTEQKTGEWYVPYADILRYASSLTWPFGGTGTLDFIPAGRQGPSYASRVNSFDWQSFYARLNGGALLDMARANMLADYDYVLLDSRTGVSDTAGICTVQMPDTLVLCFTLNNQSIDGVAMVATAVRRQRGVDRPVRIVPVPMRIELSERDRLEERRTYAQHRLEPFLDPGWFERSDANWGDVEVQYFPFYAYEEVLAPFVDPPGRKLSLLAAVNQITTMVGEQVQLPSIDAAERERILRQYRGDAGDTRSKAKREAPSASRFYQKIKARQDAWSEAGKPPRLLLSKTEMSEVDAQPTELISLLESSQFRAFWTASQRQGRLQAAIIAFGPPLIVAAALLYLAIVVFVQNPLGFSPSIRISLSAIFVGAAGGELAGMLEFFGKSAIHLQILWLRLVLDAMLGGLMATVVTSIFLGSGTSFADAAQFLLLMFLTGFGAPNLVRVLSGAQRAVESALGISRE